jgi:YVTN family beta-propeller protein
MKTREKILAMILFSSVFGVIFVFGKWERNDVFLLPDDNTVNGLGPCAICTSGDKVFVANYWSDSVSIIDLANGNRVSNVEVGDDPRAICVSGDKVFVANYESDSVSIIDLANGNRVSNVEVGDNPRAICVSDDKVFVTNYWSASVSIIDLANGNRVSNVEVGDNPHAICVSGDKVFVVNSLSGSVSILTDTSATEQVSPLLSERVSFSYPNPFNPECWIPVGNIGDENLRPFQKVKIYNLLGQLVREIDCSNCSRVYWDGKDSQGLEVQAGVYFYEVAEKKVRRMVVVK